MGNAIAIRRPPGALTRDNPRRLDLFRKTVGKELRGAEVDEALEWCEIYGANPFVRDIYFFIFDAENEEKRRVVPVLGIGLYRKIAARTGNYRPDPAPPRFAYDAEAKSVANPTGMLWCEVSVYVFSHGEWHPVTSRLKWEERAPIVPGGFKWEDTGEVWPDSGKPKKRKVADGSASSLDPKKTNWHTMPETMMAKCTEADAHRKAWPNETAGSYVDGELDQADSRKTIELTATEIADAYDTERKLEMIGGKDAVMIVWDVGGALERVPLGQIWDRSLKWMRQKDRTSTEIRIWCDRNKHSRAEMKAKSGSDYLAWWTEVERIINTIERMESSDG